MSGSGCMPELGTGSAVKLESEFVSLIGSILIVSSGWMVVSSGLNLFRAGRSIASSSNVGKFYS